ncbi:MAG: TetR/AcrR family transcriptional regulator [Nostoc sp.]|jgi:AcrR family transcriptional regulator|uniref:TetR/AcrR family transcriptional regulator n=1 Tax=unclassified Nostoc TaxID=2593658 RepID=UPI000DEC2A65|nr:MULTISPECIES: TetR/AcrR family transcriptional regulator [unclassified Nostoc]MBD2508970.1 TetR/AcrR family transcriptional regulator [Desmonostoc muscorum FACHB-395]QHG17444.1 TetR family transcriptional regulator [Nostoc sp. ATCC 53789]QLE50196.1 TetR/AcrR family transcriptional regulator [Nostoc sp. C057]RCJ31691.1 TetR family transcriptional regulator [Nostoc sp. ATCC 53789]
MVRIKTDEVDRDNSVDKVEQILQGAMQEFLQNGYAGTSMDRVAVAAGVSKATVYSHFQDKEGLFKVLIEQLASKKNNSIFGTVPIEGEPRAVLRGIGTKALELMNSDQEHSAFMRVLIGESGRFPELAQICVHAMIKPVTETLTQYLAAPELKIPDPEATARILLGALVHFHITQDVMHGRDIIPMESDRLIDALTHLITKCAD